MGNGDKIKLLYVITKLELGGAQKQLLTLIRGLNKERFITFLYTARNGLLIEDALHIPYLKLKRSRFLERSIHPLKDFLAIIDLYIFIKINRIDIVHTHSSKAGILGRLTARLAGVRAIVHTVHGWSFNDYQPIFLRLFYVFFERICARFTEKIIVVSQWDKEQGLKNSIETREKYTLIRYGINCEDFKNTAERIDLRKKLGVNASDIVIGMVSCLKPQKAPLDFVKLAGLIKKICPGIRFVLVGDGLLREKVIHLIKRLGLEKDFLLTGWSDNIAALLSTFDIFVLTSLWEGQPIAVLEAMAARLAVVATDTGGIREIVLDGKTGYLVKRGDLQSMLERIKQLLFNEQLRRNLGISASDSVRGAEFSVTNMIKQSQQLYHNIFKGREYA